jgi:hypothetical protein
VEQLRRLLSRELKQIFNRPPPAKNRDLLALDRQVTGNARHPERNARNPERFLPKFTLSLAEGVEMTARITFASLREIFRLF